MGLTFYIPCLMKNTPDLVLMAIKGADCMSRKKALSSLQKDAENAAVVGLDTEFMTQSKNSVAVLQLAFENGNVYVIQLIGVPVVPQVLFDILTNKNIFKAGVNIKNDVQRLVKHDARLAGTASSGGRIGPLLHLDREELLRSASSDPANASGGGLKCNLQYLTKKYLGIELGKDMTVTVSNWEAPILSIEQIRYAADDALASLNVALKMNPGMVTVVALQGSASTIDITANTPTSAIKMYVGADPADNAAACLKPHSKYVCTGLDKRGEPCTRTPALGSHLCKSHVEKVAKAVKQLALLKAHAAEKKAKKVPVAPLENACSGLSRKSNPCTRTPALGSHLCKSHVVKAAKAAKLLALMMARAAGNLHRF